MEGGKEKTSEFDEDEKESEGEKERRIRRKTGRTGKRKR